MSITLGVEEEFLLVDAETFRLVPSARLVVAALPAEVVPLIRLETRATQIESATNVHTELTELGSALSEVRATLDTAARSVGCRIMATGGCILRDGDEFPLADERYAQIARRFGYLEDARGLCACQVHVGVPDRRVAVAALNHIRVWLPVVQALGCNSPFVNGLETGYASTRATLLSAWPTVRPSPLLRSLEHHDELVADLRAAGAMLDHQMLYWHARLSAVHPTIEVRCADACLTVRETVLLAALVRALVTTAVRAVENGVSAPLVDEGTLTAAHWRAAKDGLEGRGFDVLERAEVPMWRLVDRLVEHVGDALAEANDLNTVHATLECLHKVGSGAARQRRVAHRNPTELARPASAVDIAALHDTPAIGVITDGPDLVAVARAVVAETTRDLY